jgi:hypothetical protein
MKVYRLPLRLSSALLLVVSGATLASFGCYQDKQGSYRAVVDTDGNLHRAVGDSAMTPVTDPGPKKSAATQPAASDAPTEKEFGIPFYPAAKPYTGLDGIAKASKESDGTLLLIMETADAPEEVAAFYRRAMPHAHFADTLHDGVRTQTFAQKVGTDGLSVDISPNGSRTRIVLMRMPDLVSAKTEAAKDTPSASQKLLSTPNPSRQPLPDLKGLPTLPGSSGVSLPAPGAAHPGAGKPTGVAPILPPASSDRTSSELDLNATR